MCVYIITMINSDLLCYHTTGVRGAHPTWNYEYTRWKTVMAFQRLKLSNGYNLPTIMHVGKCCQSILQSSSNPVEACVARTCIYIYIYIYIYVYIHTFKYIRVCIYIYIYIHTYIHIIQHTYIKQINQITHNNKTNNELYKYIPRRTWLAPRARCRGRRSPASSGPSPRSRRYYYYYYYYLYLHLHYYYY